MPFEKIVTWLVLGLVPPKTSDLGMRRYMRSVSILLGLVASYILIVSSSFNGHFPYFDINVAKASDLTAQEIVVERLVKNDDARVLDALTGKLETASRKICRLERALDVPMPDPLLSEYLATEERFLENLKTQYANVGEYRELPCSVILLTGN